MTLRFVLNAQINLTVVLLSVCSIAGCSESKQREPGSETEPTQAAKVDSASPTTFQSEKWKINSKFDREKMVQDLVDRKLVAELTEAKVSQLLGEPDSKESNHWDYEIRPENASFETFFVYFENGKVSKYEVKTNP
jgi:hypothetical protein